MDNRKKYQIKIEKNTLIFTTSSFKAEKQSVLHKGIYTKEFSSMLFASAAAIVSYLVVRGISTDTVFIHYLITVFVFIGAFLGAGRFIFKERYLMVVFNKPKNIATITRSGFLRKKTEKIPLHSIRSVEVGTKTFTPENIDGIKFVERISLQHGSFIPGLADEEEFVILSLKLSDGSERIMYAGETKDEPHIPQKEIRDFLEIEGKETCQKEKT